MSRGYLSVSLILEFVEALLLEHRSSFEKPFRNKKKTIL